MHCRPCSGNDKCLQDYFSGLMCPLVVQVTFSEVVGMSELNDGKPRKVKNCKVSSGNTSVEFDEASKRLSWNLGGYQ